MQGPNNRIDAARERHWELARTDMPALASNEELGASEEATFSPMVSLRGGGTPAPPTPRQTSRRHHNLSGNVQNVGNASFSVRASQSRLAARRPNARHHRARATALQIAMR